MMSSMFITIIIIKNNVGWGELGFFQVTRDMLAKI